MAEALPKLQQKEDQIPYEQAVEASICSPPLGYVVNSQDIKHKYRFEEDIKTYVPLMYSLEHALSKPIFCCGGSIHLSSLDQLSLEVKPINSAAGEDKWKTFKLTDLPLKELLEYCNPAPFGDLKEMKTVVDPEVRLAYEVESDRFKIEKEIKPMKLPKSPLRKVTDFPGRLRILQLIADTLAHGRFVSLDQHKLNVYGKGGFFKPHVDSPSGPDMIGTLVLCFPSPHKGGELYVNHDGLQHVFDFSQHSDDPNKIQWAAFYSDCVHEVKPVLEGHRVTVTYNITLPVSNWVHGYFSVNDPKEVEEHFEASTESPSLNTKALAKIQSELEKIRQDKSSSPFQIGLLFKHKYTSEGLQPQLLKGEDKILFDFLAEKKWKCKLMSVLSRYQADAVYPYGFGDDGELDESHEIYVFNPHATKSPWASSRYAPRHTNQPWRRYGENYRKWRVGIPFIDINRKAEDGQHVVRNKEGSEIWIGNQGEYDGVDKIYLNSAAIVDLKP